jgi:hypothetical protein
MDAKTKFLLIFFEVTFFKSVKESLQYYAKIIECQYNVQHDGFPKIYLFIFPLFPGSTAAAAQQIIEFRVQTIWGNGEI